MKIAAVLTTDVSKGGGFNQALNAIQQMARLAREQYEFVTYTTRPDNLAALDKLGIKAHYVAHGLLDRCIAICGLSETGRKLQGKLQLIGRLENAMLKDSVDLVYFVSPTSLCLALQELPYILTVWDTCHRDSPEFPEVRRFNEFHARERFYRYGLPAAVLVLTDSDDLADRISHRYGADREKLLAMPYAPAPFTAARHALSKQLVLSKYELEEGYYFYPAQFWAHKNHIRVLQALSELKGSRDERIVVFAGADQGNLPHVRKTAADMGLDNFVRILGFVPAEDLRGLYEGCAAVVMPTYFGPTNLPPLEAWSIGKPLVYSALCAGQAEDAAWLADPDDAHSLALAMREATRSDVAAELVRKGSLRLAEIDSQRRVAEDKLGISIARFAKRRECWA